MTYGEIILAVWLVSGIWAAIWGEDLDEIEIPE